MEREFGGYNNGDVPLFWLSLNIKLSTSCIAISLVRSSKFLNFRVNSSAYTAQLSRGVVWASDKVFSMWLSITDTAVFLYRDGKLTGELEAV